MKKGINLPSFNKGINLPSFTAEFPAIWLTDEQRAQLRSASKVGRDYTKPNERLELAITQIKNQNPSAFLTDKDLSSRRFFNEPQMPIPYQSYVIRN